MHVKEVERLMQMEPIDKNVKPAVELLNKKGYRILYSCDGHGDGSRTYLVVQDDDGLRKIFTELGFDVRVRDAEGYMTCDRRNDKDNIWVDVLEEIKNIKEGVPINDK